MSFPEILKTKIESLTAGVSLEMLQLASQQLSDLYRQEKIGKINENALRAAYLRVRMPATWSAIAKVLQETETLVPLSEINSLLDVGAGPGTASLAFLHLFSTPSKITLLESDSQWRAIGKALFDVLAPASCSTEWLIHDMTRQESFVKSDLIIASYSLGELSEKEREMALLRLWSATAQHIVVIEPGTPKGFQTVLQVRKTLLSQGAHLVAPCPASLACPIQAGDWCHFSVRLGRSREHRIIKEATLSYEDEKFSYMVFSKQPVNRLPNRVVRHPQHHKGHVKLTVCSNCQLEEKTVSKKQGALYKLAKDLEWGDATN